MDIIEILDNDDNFLFKSNEIKKWEVYMGTPVSDIDDELLASFDTLEECRAFAINDIEEYYKQCPETACPLSDYKIIEQNVSQTVRNELEIYTLPTKDEEDIYDIIWFYIVDNGSCMYAKKT